MYCVTQCGLKFLHSPLVLVYKKQYRWWASVELGRRFLLLLFTVSLPQNEVYTFETFLFICVICNAYYVFHYTGGKSVCGGYIYHSV